MTWPLFVLLFATATIWGVEAAGLDICAMDEMKVKTFLECTMSKAPAGTLELWENTKAMFNGRPPEQAVMALCKTSPSAGASLLAEFINQQTKADKPKFKKAIKDCTT